MDYLKKKKFEEIKNLPRNDQPEKYRPNEGEFSGH